MTLKCSLHKTHAQMTKHINYRGNSFDLIIYDYRPYIYVPREVWCPADDIVSEQIDRLGYWEEYESAIFLDILSINSSSNIVYDFGSQVGYYSMLALANGYAVKAFEADEESVAMLRRSAKINKFTDIEVKNVVINKRTKLTIKDKIHLLKCDIEGEEPNAYRILKDSFVRGDINFAIFEITPSFHDKYALLVDSIIKDGYTAYVIPNAGEAGPGYFRNPLDEIRSRPPISGKDIANWHQRNVLFVRDSMEVV